ncbi:MAG: BrxE family protein, partial [Pirellulaceae bacterium]
MPQDPTAMMEAIDTTKTARLRLVVARFGEMDRAKWWNTKGMLANLGELAVSRGFAKTHLFARSRAVFAVAGHRCDEVFNAPGAFTLWKLPPDVEDQLEDAWSQWLEEPEPWSTFL